MFPCSPSTFLILATLSLLLKSSCSSCASSYPEITDDLETVKRGSYTVISGDEEASYKQELQLDFSSNESVAIIRKVEGLQGNKETQGFYPTCDLTQAEAELETSNLVDIGFEEIERVLDGTKLEPKRKRKEVTTQKSYSKTS